MATPRVFVASTCYDLKYIRESLSYFIKTLGYEPVLSDDGAVFYDPTRHTHESCLTEVPNCQLFVLIIGGRFGGEFRDTDKSITNMEYEQAMKHRIPVFTLVEQAVHAEHHVYLKNPEVEIDYPAVDSTKIFDFIDTVRKADTSNAIEPFGDFSDIEKYLRQQWAGMMFSFLTLQNEDSRVADMMSEIRNINTRVATLSDLILDSVGTPSNKLLGDIYVLLDNTKLAHWYMNQGFNITPQTILRFTSLTELAEASGQPITPVQSDEEESLIRVGADVFEAGYLPILEEEYKDLRKQVLQYVLDKGSTVEKLLAGQQRENK